MNESQNYTPGNGIAVPTKWQWVRAEDGIIGGVCLGLARQFEVSPLLLRIAWLFTVLCFGTGILMYIFCLIAFPRSDRFAQALDNKILGVCAKISQRGDIEVGLARLIALMLLVFSGGSAIVGYIVLYFVLSENKKSVV